MLRSRALPLLLALAVAGPRRAASEPGSTAKAAPAADAIPTPPPLPPTEPPEASAPPAEPAPSDGAAKQPAEPRPPDAAEHETAQPNPPEYDSWIDVGHAFIERRLFAPVVRFDRFFSDERDLEVERSHSFLRVRTETRFRTSGDPTAGVSLRANIRLPGLNRSLERARLVITGDSDDTVSRLLPDAQGGTAPGTLGRANAELRYGVWNGLLSHVDLGAGVLFRLPPGLFAQTRYRAAVPLQFRLLGRFADTVFWRTDKGYGTTTALDFERPLGPASLARIGGTSEISQKSRGLEWHTELAGLRTIGPRVAVLAAAAAEGASRAPVSVDRYRLYTRARRDFFRRWLFFELEPEVAWPWDPAKGRFREYAVTLRLEVQFQGTEPPPPSDVPVPEPADPPPAPEPEPAPAR